MKKFYLLSLCLFGSVWVNVQAQNISVQGVLADSTGAPLPSATVVLLEMPDSLIQSFTFSNPEGQFILPKVKPGQYVLQFSYLGYQNYAMPLEIKPEDQDQNLGTLRLQSQDNRLEEISITSERIPMVIKQDTIEYNAPTFQTRPNATVEDLLKKLPGVEVEADGTIKAQGEEVKKVLVDGKEFFGDDPKIATRNLPANALDKVQVFDKLSEMAEFTGIDDGERDKTINLSLKEDRKKGYFGNLAGSYGTEERYRLKANLNRFNKTTQFSVLGNLNNINESPFTFQDYLSFAGGLSNLGSNGGSIQLNGNDDGLGSLLNQGNQAGINTIWSGGLNWSHTFHEKLEFSGNYFYNLAQNDLQSSTMRESFAGDSTFSTTESQNRNTDVHNHRFQGRLKYTISEQQDLTLRLNSSWINQEQNNQQFTQNQPADQARQTQSNILNRSDAQGWQGQGSALYRLKLQKPGRSLTARAELGWNQNKEDARLASENISLVNSQISSLDSILQLQKQEDHRLHYRLQANYTEPIAQKTFLQFTYQFQNFDQESEKLFFDVQDSDELRLNEDLSLAFQSDYTYHRGGLRWLMPGKKSNLVLSVEAQNAHLDGFAPEEDFAIQRDFFNFLPSIRWRYSFSNAKRLNFSYSTSVREPSLQELQPLVNNSNPLVIYTGNPNLRPEYVHSLAFNYFLFDAFSFTNFFATVNARYTRNKITNATEIDENFRQIINPTNVEDDFWLNAYASFGRPIRPLKIKFNLTLNQTYNRSILFVNAQENRVQRWINRLDFRLENRKKEWLDLSLGFAIDYNRSTYSEDNELDQDFFNHRLYNDLSISLLRKWNLNSSFSLQTYSDRGFGASTRIPLWEASVSKTFLKNERGELKLSVFDLLNQNQGIDRQTQFNYIEEQRANALGRYAMLTFTYKIRSVGK